MERDGTRCSEAVVPDCDNVQATSDGDMDHLGETVGRYSVGYHPVVFAVQERCYRQDASNVQTPVARSSPMAEVSGCWKIPGKGLPNAF